MPRAKRGFKARRRRNRVLKLASGYFGAKSKLFRPAHQAVMKSLTYAFVHRRAKKRDFRKLWIARINAGVRMHGLSYSRFINGLKLANIEINRKMLSEMAIHDPAGFAKICELAKSKL